MSGTQMDSLKRTETHRSVKSNQKEDSTVVDYSAEYIRCAFDYCPALQGFLSPKHR